MIFKETPLAGALIIEAVRLEDERGFFATEFSVEEFQAKGLNPHVAQTAISFNKRKGTLRGLHFQACPHGQAKLVRCQRGAAYDVILDVRRDSPTFRRWLAIELTAENQRAVFIPEGFAHGFQTLEDSTVIAYQFSSVRCETSERGVRWNDPSVNVTWPLVPTALSERDSSFPDFNPIASSPV